MTMITSVKPENELWPTDVLIEDLENAGLPAPSIIRFKLFTLDHRLILGRLGLLSDFDCAAVQKKLQEVLSLHP